MPARVERVGAAQICDPERPTTCVFGGKGRKRLEFMRLPHETKEDLLEDEKAWELIKPWGFHQGNCVLERKVVYTFNARWASRFYKERVILGQFKLSRPATISLNGYRVFGLKRIVTIPQTLQPAMLFTLCHPSSDKA